MPELPRINSPLVQEQLDDTVKGLADAIDRGQVTTLEEMRVEVFARYQSHFSSLINKPFTPVPYPPTSYKSSAIWNVNSSNIQRTLRTLFKEAESLNNAALAQHTLLTQSVDDIIAKASVSQSKLLAIRETIEERQFFDKGKSTQILSDTFITNDNVDFSKSSGIQVDLTATSVSLQVAGNLSRANAVLDIEVTAVGKTVDINGTASVHDGLPIKPRAYEGDRFGFIGQARPQTGVWRIEAKNTKIDKTTPDIVIGTHYSNLDATERTDANIINSSAPFDKIDTTGERLTPNDYIFDDRPSTNIQWKDQGTDSYAKTITREDFEYVETLPTEAQLKEYRLNMVDNDPNSFWEIEYTPSLTALRNALNATGGAYKEYQVIATNHLKTNSSEDLIVDLTITLDDSYVLNYIDLLPFFFSSADDANFEILDLTTQESVTSPRLSIPGFDIDFDNVIGKTANNSMSDNQLEQAGVFNRFAFKGRGVWTFPSRKVTFIHIKIKQDVALPNPYQVKAVQLLKKTSYSISQSKSLGTGKTDIKTTTSKDYSGSASALERGRVTQLIQFGYLETVLSNLDQSSTGLLAGTSSAGSARTNSETSSGVDKLKSTYGKYEQLGTAIGSTIGSSASAANVTGAASTAGAAVAVAQTAVITAAAGALGGILGGKFDAHDGTRNISSNSLSSDYNDSGFQINQEFMRTNWDRARYAIGIREIGMYSKTYAPGGVIVSRPYTILAGNKKVTLEINHRIPLAFSEYDAGFKWISYFIVINGVDFPIRPSKLPPPQLPYLELPDTIKLEEHGGPTDLITIAIKAVLTRPSEARLRNSDSESPFLNGYKILVDSL